MRYGNTVNHWLRAVLIVLAGGIIGGMASWAILHLVDGLPSSIALGRSLIVAFAPPIILGLGFLPTLSISIWVEGNAVEMRIFDRLVVRRTLKSDFESARIPTASSGAVFVFSGRQNLHLWADRSIAKELERDLQTQNNSDAEQSPLRTAQQRQI